MDKQHNIVGWFEIPVTNMERAIKFYETLFGIKLSRNKMGDMDMAWFPGTMEGPGAAGSLVCIQKCTNPRRTDVSSISLHNMEISLRNYPELKMQVVLLRCQRP
jgi:predicted enzyme related to lactoylglutathione lyase